MEILKTKENKNSYCVYRHLKPCGEVFYIGIGKNIKRAFSKNGRSNFWHRIVKKYNYEIQILKNDLTFEQAEEIEKILIDYYGRIDLKTGSLCNLTNGGGGCEKLSKEHKLKISLGKKGIPSKLKGHPLNENTKNKMKENHADVSGKNNPMYNKKHTDNTIKLISESNSGNKNKRSQKVIDMKSNITYSCIREASQFLGIHKSTLASYLKGKLPNKSNMRYLI